MMRKRLEVLIETALLIIGSVIFQQLDQYNILDPIPLLAITMMISTAIALFGGCMLQTLGLKNAATAVQCIVFFILCTCLFYSVHLIDFVTFGVCTVLIIRKSLTLCEPETITDNTPHAF